MRYLRVAEPKQTKITLYPLVCWHVGASQARYDFIDEMCYRVKNDPTARWIYLGDGGECVTKSSKGMIYEQTMNPQEQFNWLVSKLHPMRSKGLFGVKGNHGYRTFKESGLGFDESLMMALQIPYLGTSAFVRLLLGRASFHLFFHHGLDSSSNFGGKINKAKAFETFIDADAIFSAHSHICCEIPPRYMSYLAPGSKDEEEQIRWKATYEYICGCAYDSRSGYAEDKGYQPILPGHLSVEFGTHRHNGNLVKYQQCTIYRPGV